MTREQHKWLIFQIANKRYGIDISNVVTIVRAARVTILPDSSEILFGIIDIHGEILPVINLRYRFKAATKQIEPEDRFIVVKKGRRKLVLVVDAIENIYIDKEYTKSRINLDQSHSGKKISTSLGSTMVDVLKDENGIILIYSIDQILNTELELAIEEIISEEEKAGFDE